MFRPIRRIKQATDEAECKRILKTEKRSVLALNGEDGYPAAFPMNFVYDENDGCIYFHSAQSGLKVDCIKSSDKACFSVWNEGYCDPGDWGHHVSCVMIYGRISLITDYETTVEKAKLLGNKYYTDPVEVDGIVAEDGPRVQMLKLTPEHMTGKMVYEK